MEKMLEIAITQVPALGVLAAVVWMCLGAIKELRDKAELERQTLVQSLRDLHDEDLKAREETRAAIERNTDAFIKYALMAAGCPLRKDNNT